MLKTSVSHRDKFNPDFLFVKSCTKIIPIDNQVRLTNTNGKIQGMIHKLHYVFFLIKIDPSFCIPNKVKFNINEQKNF